MYAFLRNFNSKQFGNIFHKYLHKPVYIVPIKTQEMTKTMSSLQTLLYEHKIPNGRWNLDENYNGSMSRIATKNNEFNNHDHCGGDLCKFPPKNT
tara:strand:+ start:11065 stop:11349 length:285 start_codon:yes stop_codon:yes gene_type:complete